MALTVELANEIPLPQGPFKRHAAVRELLADPEMVGDTRVVTSLRELRELTFEPGEHIVGRVSIWPLLGRRALRDVAKILTSNDFNELGE